MRKWGNGEVTFWNINFAKISNFGKVRTAKAMCWGLLGGFGRKRRSSEEGREGF